MLEQSSKHKNRGGHRYQNLETATATFRILSYSKRNRNSETILQIVEPQLATPQLRNSATHGPRPHLLDT